MNKLDHFTAKNFFAYLQNILAYLYYDRTQDCNLNNRMQELAWLIGNDVDLEKAQINQFFRVPFLEAEPMVFQEIVEKVRKGAQWRGGIAQR